MWIVRSSVGAMTARSRAVKATGAHASVIAAASGASSARGSRARSQAPETWPSSSCSAGRMS